MIIDLKRCIEFPEANGGKKLLQVGRHTVDSNMLDHWFVKALINEGTIILLGDKPPAPVTLIYPDKPITHRVEVQGVSMRGTLPAVNTEAEVVPVFDAEKPGKIKKLLAKDKKPAVKEDKVTAKKPVAKKPVVTIKRRAK